MCAGSIFGLAPVLALSAGSLYPVLKDGGRGTSVGSVGLRLRRLLVAGELALALVLLTGTGLMVKSFWRMNAHPASFEPEKIGVMKVWLSGPGYRERGPALVYARQLLDQLGRVPGVQAAAITNASGSGGVDVEGPPRFAPGQAPQVFFRAASSGYSRVVGVPLVKGRWTIDDEAVPAVMVNETFVRRVFGMDEPLGPRIRIKCPLATIAGLVRALKVS